MTEAEGEKWRQLALYLASCHAATAEWDAGLKRAPLTRIERGARICQSALDVIEGAWHERPQDEEHVKKRLREAVALCAKR